MPTRLIGAASYQPKDDVIRRLAEQNEGNVRRGMTTAFGTLRQALPMDRLEDLLRNGDLNGIINEMPFDGLDADMNDVFVQLGAIFDKGASKRIDQLGISRPFDRLDPEVLGVLTTYRSDMVQQITDATRDALNYTLYSGALSWKAPAEMAMDIRSIIGLTDRQAGAVLNYRRLLEEGDLTALDRDLRYRTYDRAFISAVDNDTTLSAEKIDAMVDGYARNYLSYRATTIARTESLRAANMGAREGVEQAVRREGQNRGEVKRFWLIAIDERTCDFCRSIPEMNPDGVGLDESYDSIEGPVFGPEDSHPNCRCTETFKFMDEEGGTDE